MSDSSENISNESVEKSKNRVDESEENKSDSALSPPSSPKTHHKNINSSKKKEKKEKKGNKDDTTHAIIFHAEENQEEKPHKDDPNKVASNPAKVDHHPEDGNEIPKSEEQKENEERMHRNQTMLLKLMNNADENQEIYLQANDEQELFKHLTNRLEAPTERNLEEQKEKENYDINYENRSNTSQVLLRRAQTYIEGILSFKYFVAQNGLNYAQMEDKVK